MSRNRRHGPPGGTSLPVVRGPPFSRGSYAQVMRERDAPRRAVVAAQLVVAGTAMLGVGGCGEDASLVKDTAVVSPAPQSPAIAFTFGGAGIYAIRPDGSRRVRLTGGPAHPDVGTGAADPAWSPDGATLAFARTIRVSFEDFRSQIHLLEPGGGRPRPLTVGIDGVSVSGPAWSPTDSGSPSSAPSRGTRRRARSWSRRSTAAASRYSGASPTTSRRPEAISGRRPGRRTARASPTRSGASTGATASAPPST
jgi:hypothetical protein